MPRSRPRRPAYAALHFDDSQAQDSGGAQIGWVDLKGRKRRVVVFALYSHLVLAGCFLVAVLTLQIIFIRSYPPHSPRDMDSPDWPYYKNSGFQECSTRMPDQAVDCEYLFVPGRLSNGDEHETQGTDIPSNATQIRAISFKDNITASTYSWCDLQSCFAETAQSSGKFQVLPTVPLPSAFGYPNLAAWHSLTLTALGTTSAILSLVRAEPHRTHECKGAGVLGNAFRTYDFVAFVVWWTVFASRRSDAMAAGGLSIVLCFTVWKHAMLSHFHPTACWLEVLDRKRWRFSGLVIRAALYSAAMAIWLSSFLLSFQTPSLAEYECVEALLPDAAEASAKCDLRSICAAHSFGLLTDPGFNNIPYYDGAALSLLELTMLTSMALLPVMGLFSVSLVHRVIDYCRGEYVEAMSHSEAIPPAMMMIGWSFFQIFAVIFGCVSLANTVTLMKYAHHEATVAFHVECQVVHIAMSPWRERYDINGYNQVWRIIRGWPNV